jgi:AcrR family transcriptional regulator
VARKSAEERREEIVEIAFRHFAEGGYNGTSTEDIAREAGISQPYLFRLFRTKKELFLACSDRCYEQVAGVFSEAAASAAPEERMSAMGHAYEDKLLRDRHALRFQMQSHATGDPEIHAQVREGFNELRQTVAKLAGVPEVETWQFFADGMLLNVVAMLDLDWQHPNHAER